MTSVADIERAVERLDADELSSFRAWFDSFDADRFDSRIARDAASGRLDRFVDEALAEARRGDAKPV